MSYLLLGAGFVVLAWAIIASALNAQSSTLVRVVKITLGLLVIAAMIALLITGRYRLAISLAPVLLLTAIRWHRMISTLQSAFSGYSSMAGRATPGQASDVESPYLRMILDHDSGTMAGEVLQGRFAGRRLDTLELGELLTLLDELQQHGYRSKQDRAIVQSFDAAALKRARTELGSELTLVQLTGDPAWAESDTDFDALLTDSGLAEVAGYADGLGPWLPQVAGVDETAGELRPTGLVGLAHDHGLFVHAYTLRHEHAPPPTGGFDRFLEFLIQQVGLDGVFTDFPDRAISVRARV